MDNSLENKLIILYFLSGINSSINMSEITTFIVENNYADYISANNYLAELFHLDGKTIETKNYSGTIYGNNVDRTWRAEVYNRTNEFYNPILQILLYLCNIIFK